MIEQHVGASRRGPHRRRAFLHVRFVSEIPFEKKMGKMRLSLHLGLKSDQVLAFRLTGIENDDNGVLMKRKLELEAKT
jgi:hypothetical protein